MKSCEHENGIMVFDSDECPFCRLEVEVINTDIKLIECQKDLDWTRSRITELEARLTEANDELFKCRTEIRRLEGPCDTQPG